jgi:hypothetical protein
MTLAGRAWAAERELPRVLINTAVPTVKATIDIFMLGLLATQQTNERLS